MNYLPSIISDVDECSVMNPCATSTNCVNTPGSYKCVCYGSLSEPNCAAGMNINILHTNTFVFIYDVLQLIVSNLQLIVSYLKLIVRYFKLSVCYQYLLWSPAIQTDWELSKGNRILISLLRAFFLNFNIRFSEDMFFKSVWFNIILKIAFGNNAYLILLI